MSEQPEKACLIDVVLDERTIGRGNADIEHERAVAIFDLIEENYFWPVGHSADHKDANGDAKRFEYKLNLTLVEQRLAFEISDDVGESVATHILSLTPFRRIVKDYFQICESYYDAIRSSTPSQIEAIDMARRGLHNEGSETLQERLDGKVKIDFQTARRLFTLICVLHWRG